jgi:hypothetical protein
MADFVVSLTRRGREIEAQQLLYGYGYKIEYFVLGAGGHDPGNPMLALPLNTDVTELPAQFFGPEPVDVAELVNATCPRFTCIVQPGEAVGGISNIGLIGTIVYVPSGSPPGAPTVGDTFLHSISNFPLRYKLSSSRETFTVSIKT